MVGPNSHIFGDRLPDAPEVAVRGTDAPVFCPAEQEIYLEPVTETSLKIRRDAIVCWLKTRQSDPAAWHSLKMLTPGCLYSEPGRLGWRFMARQPKCVLKSPRFESCWESAYMVYLIDAA